MPQIDFSPEHKKETPTDFDRLKLKKDERARIVLMEKPTYAWVHTLRAPKIVNGVAVKITKERRNGDKYTDFDMDFIGRPLCIGDYGIIAERGLDAANCPACAKAKESDQVNPPERRFAMNVIRYALKSDGTNLVTPFSCSCVVWGYTEGIYAKLTDIATEYGGLIGRDLLLGPCVNEGYQKYEIMPSARSAWQLDENIKATVMATFQGNRIDDLERACGRKVERRWMEEDLDGIAARWRIANGETSDGTERAEQSTLTEGLGDLLATTTPPGDPLNPDPWPEMATPKAAAPTPEPAKADNLDFADLLTPEQTPAKPEPPAAAESKPPADPMDFEKLLTQLS